MTHQPPAMIRWVEEGCDTVEKATELCLSLLAGSSLKFTKLQSFCEVNRVNIKLCYDQ